MNRRHYTVTGLFVVLALSVWFVDSVLDYYVYLGGSFTDLSGREFVLRAIASGAILILGIIISMAFSADRRVRDEIAKRKKSEEERESLGWRLQQAQKLESLAILAGGVAHDLNNTLSPLVSYCDLMLLRLPEDSPHRKHVESMGRAAEEAADLIHDLLTLARRGRYDMIPTDLNTVVKSYLESLAFEKTRKEHPNVTVKISLGKGMSLLQGSHVHLSKAVMNLVVNAFEAMPDGGYLSISTSQEHVEKLRGDSSPIAPGPYLLLRVQDSGSGIRAEQFGKIFDPYFSNKSMGKSGTGLGLSVVYGVLKDHNGQHDIISELGKGAEFILYFPVTTEPIHEPIPTGPIMGQGESVLVVDDIQIQRQIAAEILISLGYKVATTHSGREAIRLMRERSFDLILLDMVLEDGFHGMDTFLEMIRLVPGQHVLLVSAHDTADHAKQMQELGAGAFIQKPFKREELGRAIRMELEVGREALSEAT